MYKKLGKTFATTVLSTAVMCAITVSSQAETLNQVYQQALQNDHQYRAAQAAYEANRQSKAINRAGLLPQISGQLQWDDREANTSGEGDSFVNGVFTRDAPIDNTNDTVTKGYSITLTQPLFDLNAWHSYKKGQLDEKVAEAQLRADQQDLIIRTAEAYFDVLRSVDDLETTRAEENALSHSLEQTRKRFEVGLTAITDVHEAQAAYDSTLAERLLAEGQVSINFEALEVLTGNAYNFLSPLKKDFPVIPPSPAERSSWVSYATENNLTLAVASLTSAAARQTSKAAKANHYPTVSGQLFYQDSNNDNFTNNFIVTDETGKSSSITDRDTKAITVTVSVPIFSGGRTSASRKQAHHSYVQTQENMYQTQRDIVQSARSLHLRVLTNVSTVKARQQAITSNRSALEATQAGYDVGTRDLVNVLDAQRNLYRAQRDYLDSLYTYVLDTLRLKEVAGMLTPKDIKELDLWLDQSKQVTR